MPFLKRPQTTEPLVKLWDKKAQKYQYTGEWMDNEKHGKVTQVWKKTGMIYDGDWRCGKREGCGTLISRYKFLAFYAKGAGTYFYSLSAFYEGQWRGDQRSGRGQMQYENGELYEGEWLKDKHHGEGLLLLANGNRFVGTWSDGQKNGHGKFFYLDRGQLYESFWVDDVAKCGTLSDFGREAAVRLTVYPIPKVCLQDSQAVLMEARAYFTEDKEKSTETTIPSHTIARQYVP
uniref:MORN repeat-containing protein 3 n=1 Tax=Cyprinus carpio TaxID=7962 RepID=A0A8C1UXC0_CYPCA